MFHEEHQVYSPPVGTGGEYVLFENIFKNNITKGNQDDPKLFLDQQPRKPKTPKPLDHHATADIAQRSKLMDAAAPLQLAGRLPQPGGGRKKLPGFAQP